VRTFEIEHTSFTIQRYRVEAGNDAEAIVKLLDGLALPVDNGLDFIEVADDYGLPR